MTHLLITSIALYLLLLCLYLLWERRVKNGKRGKKKTGIFRSPPQEDIMGKSKFDTGHLRTKASTAGVGEKGIEKDPIFAAAKEKNISPAIPVAELDAVFASTSPGEDSGEEMIDDIPEEEEEYEEGYEEAGDDYALGDDMSDEGLDTHETDGPDTEGYFGTPAAQGNSFDDLADRFEQVVSDEREKE